MNKNWKSLDGLHPCANPSLKSQLQCVSIFATCVNNRTGIKLCPVNQNDP